MDTIEINNLPELKKKKNLKLTFVYAQYKCIYLSYNIQ